MLPLAGQGPSVEEKQPNVATGSRRKAFKYSFLSGLAEPIGALARWLGAGLCAVVGLALMAFKLANRKTRIPFGPYMLAGAFLAVFAAAPIADWYSALLTPAA